jgi:hypothetical protein
LEGIRLSKELVIRVNKCVLVMSENELMGALAAKPEIFQNAIRRGKGLLRAQNVERRQYQVDRWQLYEWLKGDRIPENAASLIESMSIQELREGTIEFLLTKQREAQIK